MEEWSKRIYSLGNYPERVLKPKINYMELGTLYKQKEIVIEEELENFEDLEVKDQYRFYSSGMDDLLEMRERSGMRVREREREFVVRERQREGREEREERGAGFAGRYSFAKDDGKRNDRSLDFTKNLDISGINVKYFF